MRNLQRFLFYKIILFGSFVNAKCRTLLSKFIVTIPKVHVIANEVNLWSLCEYTVMCKNVKKGTSLVSTLICKWTLALSFP